MTGMRKLRHHTREVVFFGVAVALLGAVTLLVYARMAWLNAAVEAAGGGSRDLQDTFDLQGLRTIAASLQVACRGLVVVIIARVSFLLFRTLD